MMLVVSRETRECCQFVKVSNLLSDVETSEVKQMRTLDGKEASLYAHRNRRDKGTKFKFSVVS